MRCRGSRRDDHGVENGPDLAEPCGVARCWGGNHTDSRVRRARFMAIPRGHRFDIAFDSAFPQGLVLIGGVAPDNEYQTRRTMPPVGRCARNSTR
jgi:hypothetical protein